MATDWSDDIVISDLSDEPAFSEDLSSIIERIDQSDKHVPHVVLNMAGVTYLNSSNLGQLLKLRKVLADRHRMLKLCSVNEEVSSLFSIAGLNKVFRFAPDPMTALAGIQIESESSDGDRA
ncbi:MAG: STAS domain-containing protein [Phycisphaerales bacterium]